MELGVSFFWCYPGSGAARVRRHSAAGELESFGREAHQIDHIIVYVPNFIALLVVRIS